MITTHQHFIMVTRFDEEGGCPTGKLMYELSTDMVRYGKQAVLSYGGSVNMISGDDSYRNRPSRLFVRLLSDLRWMAEVSWWFFVHMPRHQGERIVVITSDPPLFYLPMILIGKLRGFKVVCWLHDIYPEIATRLGVIPTWTGEPLRWIRNYILRKAWKVVVVGRCMQSYLKTQGIESVVITNWVDTKQVPVKPFPEKFKILYPGRQGRVHGTAVERIGEYPVFRLTASTDTEFYNRLGEASAHLITLRPEVIGLCVPSKAYAAMASGRPIYFFGPSTCEIALLINEWNCNALNVYFELGGQNARKAIEQTADRDVCVNKWIKLLDAVQ